MRGAGWQWALLGGLAVALVLEGGGSGLPTRVTAAASGIKQPLSPDVVSLRQFDLTPRPLPTASAGATATPTPRAIVIPTSASGANPTRTPTPGASAPTAVPTATPQSIVIVAPTPTITAITGATATAIPTPLPTAPPIATVAAPTMAPVSQIRIDFAAADWRGGYFQSSGQPYGRPWVAVYGALSEYPRALLSFTIDATPSGEATLSISGLDDELGTLNPVTLEVNGERIYEGPSPFANWNGSTQNVDAAWTTVPFTIPSGVLQPGPNEIAFANLSPVASFNAPPYVLVADAVLETAAAGTTGSAAPTVAPIVPIVPADSTASFTAEDWRGGFYRGDDVYYGRPWTALYGAQSEYPRASVAFRLDTAPTDAAVLTVAGLDDEWAELNPIAIEVNGEPAFEGPSPFLNWDGVGNGENAAWTQAQVTIPAELLRDGRNEITIANLTAGANFSAPPYVLLGDATLRVPGANVTPVSRDGGRGGRNNQSVSTSGDDGGDDGGGEDG